MKKPKHTLKFTIDPKPKMVKDFESIELSNEIKWREPDKNIWDGSTLNFIRLPGWENS